MPGDPVADDEISRGLVLHLDPDELEVTGATFSCAEPLRVQGNHFFACIDVLDTEISLWVPLYTKAGPGRVPIDTAGSSGHPKITAGTIHYHPEQVWTATPAQVREAARSGGDLSRVGSRNRLDPDRTPALE